MCLEKLQAMLDALELAEMQAVQEQAFPDVCSINRPTMTSDGMGGQSYADNVIATNVPCRLVGANLQAQELARAQRPTATTAWTLTLPASQDVGPKDKVVIGGTTYEVLGVTSGGNWATAKRVTLVLVQ